VALTHGWNAVGDINLYRYVFNNPVNLTDPDGRIIPFVARVLLSRAISYCAEFPTICRGVARSIAGGALDLLGMRRNDPGLIQPPDEPIGAKSRSLEDLSSLRGASAREIDELIPEGFVQGTTRRGGGIRYLNPERRGESVRVMPGNPRDPDPIKRGPYLRVSRDGRVSDPIPLEGNPTLP